MVHRYQPGSALELETIGASFLCRGGSVFLCSRFLLLFGAAVLMFYRRSSTHQDDQHRIAPPHAHQFLTGVARGKHWSLQTVAHQNILDFCGLGSAPVLFLVCVCLVLSVSYCFLYPGTNCLGVPSYGTRHPTTPNYHYHNFLHIVL